ncbi:MAG TPA: hypothetical protein VFK66_12835 [Oryzihumus sp.]|nr:hypothetical protein [Oryzihumus sp.]
MQDGEIPELHTGSTLHDHAVRASCWSIRETPAQEGVIELPGPDPSGDNAPHYELTGTVEWGQEASPENYILERFSPDFFVPVVGTRAAVVCRLEVMAVHETEDFGYPELGRDWVVQHLKLQHRALVPVPGHARTWNVDKVLHVDDIERMHRWADETSGDHVTYLLDLQLPT